MADFVAVIRRAVDGLSDNNAEMRQKVYEKARGAVRRQLESMNPRPSDDLVKRQLDKLEAAINSVEIDHAEALPAEDIAPEPAEEVLQPEPVAEEPAAVPEAEEAVAETEPEHHEEPVAEAVDAPAEKAEAQAIEEEPAAEPPVEDTPPAEAHAEPEPEHAAPVVEDAEPAEDLAGQEEQPAIVEAHNEPSWHVEAAPADDYVPSWQEPEQEPAHEAEAEETAEAAEPQVQADPVHGDPVHEEQVPDAEPAADTRMPSAEAQWNWNEASPADVTAENHVQPADTTASDPLTWDWPEEKAAQPEATPEQASSRDWSDLDELLGHGPKAGAAAAGAAAMAEAGLADATSPTPTVETARAPQRSFRAEPRKSRLNVAALAAVVALVALVGGAGAAYWFNRDTVNDWVNERIVAFTAPSTETPAETPQTAETAEGSRSLPAANTTSGETAQTPDTAAGTSTNTEVAVATPSGTGKFTQRLLADGTEVDEGPAAALDGATPEEGKSVAAQTPETAGVTTEDGPAAASGTTTGEVTPETDGAAQTPAGTGDATTTTEGGTPAATGEQPAIGVTQKMFLYEERLGQTAPTAIEGTVAWSSAEESPGGDAKDEPVVRAQVNVPSKGLTALITFRRNGDRSLPASHLVELVFSLPENFEGGGIESVQRVAMKRTEQDRGDALIAVPAKITDDFHMIALNDFPEAIAKNTDLLRTRSWIDIPITYRNGRRALITLDKGTAGAEAFDKVMKAWATLGTPGSQ
ncbi:MULTISPECIES: hypothetical protein [unclassified Shinella]|uniref:hypothetical protein n=1 Tax=unclassified Shinella TaxID=2643062 RepID=UPI00225D31D1|nr:MULTISPECIES: hypothetical protein [unclassified Shinella]MCO5138960.1 hypothetical protein [Shinella sp.]MDC7256311.1 hypothetical protein [Shinella sp. YE25]CAI0339171.1 conserved hypothetical protein [Rhizobiaceae bacterium]CAK7257584.1 Transmembrane protein [Shinella sp. WSC3-e]